jgi:hypothetical protein
MKYLLFLFFAIPFFSACQEKSGQKPDVSPETLTGMWLHSFEEDSAGQKVYRREDYPFPPARGREGFEIRENGTFIYRVIAPADGYLTYEGQWQLVEGYILQVRFEREEISDFSLEILHAEEDKLVVRGG